MQELPEFVNLMAFSDVVIHMEIDGVHRILRPGGEKDVTTSADALVWHYIQKDRFFGALEAGGLFLRRLTEYHADDPFEGASPAVIARIVSDIVREKGGDVEDVLSKRERHLRDCLQHVKIHCWHKREHEAKQMWDRYGGENEAVAIVSTFGRLRDLGQGPIQVGHVDYIDYETEGQIFSNPATLAHWKRQEYEDEREVRIVTMDWPPNAFPINDANRAGSIIPVNFDKLIGRVVISPYSPDILDEVNARLVDSGVTALAEQSALTRKPVF